MTSNQSKTSLHFLIGGAILLASVVGVGAVVWVDWFGEKGNQLSDAFQYDLQKYQKIDPAWIRFHSYATYPVKMQEPRAIAVGLEDHVFVAGDQCVLVFPSISRDAAAKSGEGASSATVVPEPRKISLDAEPHGLAVGNAEHMFPGRIYVGMKDHIEVFSPEGTRIASWASLGYLTSIALSEREVFVADAKAKAVWRFDTDGKSTGKIEKFAEPHGTHVFVVPSPYFSVAMSSDGLLRVANPGMHHVEAYTMDGHLELSWGQASNERIEGFCGCCNPSYIAVLPDGRIVTSEKGIPRVKVYGADGQFDGVVVGSDVLSPTATALTETREEHRLRPAPVATDSEGHVLVLDPAARCVRFYAENEK